MCNANSLPFSVDLQILFVDRFGNILEKLSDENGVPVLVGGEVDSEGNVISASSQVIQIEMDQDKIDRILSAESLIVEVVFSTSNNGNSTVKVKEDQKVTIKIGMFASIESSL